MLCQGGELWEHHPQAANIQDPSPVASTPENEEATAPENAVASFMSRLAHRAPAKSGQATGAP